MMFFIRKDLHLNDQTKAMVFSFVFMDKQLYQLCYAIHVQYTPSDSGLRKLKSDGLRKILVVKLVTGSRMKVPEMLSNGVHWTRIVNTYSLMDFEMLINKQ